MSRSTSLAVQSLFNEIKRGRKESLLARHLDAKVHFLTLTTEALSGPVISKLVGYGENPESTTEKVHRIINEEVKAQLGTPAILINNSIVLNGVVLNKEDLQKILKKGKLALVNSSGNLLGAFTSSFGTAQQLNSSLTRRLVPLLDLNRYDDTDMVPGFDVGHTIIRKGAFAGMAASPLYQKVSTVYKGLKAFTDSSKIPEFLSAQPESIKKVVNAYKVSSFEQFALSASNNIDKTTQQLLPILIELDRHHSYSEKITATLTKDFAKAIKSIGLEINITVPQERIENQRVWGTLVEGAISSQFDKLIKAIRFSPNIFEHIEAEVRKELGDKNAKVDYSKKTIKVVSPVEKRNLGVISIHKGVIPKPKSKPKVRSRTGQFTSLISIQTLINQALSTKIKENMGTPALNNRTGRFAESAKVVNMSQSRQGMITAFYSYMKSPYQTFEPGFAQGSEKRNPKTLISKSIREIASAMVGNRLRAVSI